MHKSNGSDIWNKMTKSTRAIIAQWCLEKADEYFHNGVPHKRKKAFSDDWYQKVRRQLLSEKHIHLSGNKVKEIMPWLWLSAKAKPDEIETWLISSFWLASEVNQPDSAIKVLLSSQQLIGADYKIKLELGRLYFKQNRIEEATKAFDAGLALWPGKYNPEDTETKNDKAKLLVYKAFLYEQTGARTHAIDALNNVLAMFPERKYISKWIEELKTSSTTTSSKDIIDQMHNVPEHDESYHDDYEESEKLHIHKH